MLSDCRAEDDRGRFVSPREMRRKYLCWHGCCWVANLDIKEVLKRLKDFCESTHLFVCHECSVGMKWKHTHIGVRFKNPGLSEYEIRGRFREFYKGKSVSWVHHKNFGRIVGYHLKPMKHPNSGVEKDEGPIIPGSHHIVWSWGGDIHLTWSMWLVSWECYKRGVCEGKEKGLWVAKKLITAMGAKRR